MIFGKLLKTIVNDYIFIGEIKLKMNKEERKQNFLQKSSKVHNNKYKYDKIDYVNSNTKVCIICPEHGEFWQEPKHHVSGHGCPECMKEYLRKTKQDSVSIFIEKARNIHGDRYDYSKVNYVNQRTKVTIICKEHGEFEQIPYHHINGHGCPKCTANKNGISKRLTIEHFINKANQVHNNYYNYSKVNYINSFTKVLITCPIHGDFEQTPSSHLSGRGCPKCKRSNGEILVAKVLQDLNLEYIEQYKIPVINEIFTNRKEIKIDFYIPKLKLAIEYNGIQHYIPQNYFGGVLKFQTYQQPRDQYVENFCKANDIYLLNISYEYSDYENMNNYIKEYVDKIPVK